MLAVVIELNLTNIFLFAGLAVFLILIGYISRRTQNVSLMKKVGELEREMLICHAEVLQLQREKIELLKSISEPTIPVISITSSKDEKNADKLPDVSARKKLLGSQPAVKQQSGG